MITKITADNDREYFAPRFKQISEALGYEITSLESYFANLKEIAALSTSKGEAGKYLLVMPADEPVFEINANTRVINIPAEFKANGAGVLGDTNAEMLVFKIDRYFDYQDFMETDAKILWNFTATGSRNAMYEEVQAQAAFAKDDTLEPGNVLFGFVITDEMTKSKGTLSFSVRFSKVENGVEVYSYNTQIATIAINDSLQLSDPTQIKNVAKGLLSRLSDSAYTPDNVTPIDAPVWQLGDADEDGVLLGLPAKLNFNIGDDGVEDEFLAITAQATTPSIDGVMRYTWATAPVDEEPVVIRPEDDVTQVEDYFKTTDAKADADSTYYLKAEDGSIAVDHPIEGVAAQQYFDNGTELYELGSTYKATVAGRYQVSAQADKEITQDNGKVMRVVSNRIESNVCVVPAAEKPVVELAVNSTLDPDADNFVIEDAEAGYVFISAEKAPEVIATVTSSGEEALGAIAVEAVKADAVDLTDAAIESGSYEFKMLPENGKVQVNADDAVEEGAYKVRAINRRNHTYAVSDLSNEIKTSFVAPAINAITLSADGKDILAKGANVRNALDEAARVGLTPNYPVATFTMVDDSENYPDAVATYFIEEVDVGDNDEITVRKVDKPEPTDELDSVEIKNGTFEIDRDAGNYRIRIENRYHGTLRVAYTDVFEVTSTIS